LNASAECWQVFADVTGFELNHAELVRDFHQLAVDAYGAQHAGGQTPPIRVFFSLVGLHLALDRGQSGTDVRAAHQRLGRRRSSWPLFDPPDQTGTVTAADVAAAGVDAGSVAGHAQAMRDWAESVWHAWRPQHPRVIELTQRLLG
jgi:hypothetical protein